MAPILAERDRVALSWSETSTIWFRSSDGASYFAECARALSGFVDFVRRAQ